LDIQTDDRSLRSLKIYSRAYRSSNSLVCNLLLFHRDPQIQKEFVNALYNDEGPFLQSIPNALHDDGIFISQVGESSDINDPGEQFTDDRNRYRLVNSLSKLGFSTVRSYSDNAHSGFYYPWQFVTAFKKPETKADWFANPSLVNLKIRNRSMVTVDGGSPFKFFDGATMQSYYYPTKPIEMVYCRDSSDEKDCKEGHGFDLGRENLPMSTIEVRESSVGENTSKGVYSKVDIPRDTYVGLEEQISTAVRGDAHTYDTFLKTSKLSGGKSWGSALSSYIQGYGDSGENGFVVDATVGMYNHACDGNNEAAVEESGAIYNPASDRQVNSYLKATTLQDIKQGEKFPCFIR
jgi:hypothetical protein